MASGSGLVTDGGIDPAARWTWPTGQIRDLMGLPEVLARSGSLELRLATTKQQIRKAQKLRFQTFYVEGDAIPSRRNALSRRDKCPFDRICDHLLAIDNAAVGPKGTPKPRVVGTYRLLRSDVAQAHQGFYSATEFAIEPLLARHPDKRFLELGRSCVRADYRSRRVIDLLWRGIGIYAQHHRIDALIGCASLPGTDSGALSVSLSFLAHHAAAGDRWEVSPLPGRAAPFELIAAERLDARRAMAALPPLVKAYVRAGARFASGAVIDPEFGTTDVFALLPFGDADVRYMAHFGGLELMAGAASAAN